MVDVTFRFLNKPGDIQEAAWVTARRGSGLDFTARVFSRYLVSEHSPIRRLVLAWRVEKMNRRASTHFVRHTHSPSYIGGSRPDWFAEACETNDHLQDSNCQALIDLMRKRLCFRSWAPTREVAEALKRSLMEADVDRIGVNGDAPPAFYRALGRVLVPNCIYRAGCPEGHKGCGLWDRFLDDAVCHGTAPRDLLTIERRYELYNVLCAAKKETENDGN